MLEIRGSSLLLKATLLTLSPFLFPGVFPCMSFTYIYSIKCYFCTRTHIHPHRGVDELIVGSD